MDFFGPVNGKHFLVILDAHSKWPAVFELSSTSTCLTIKLLRSLLRFEIPKVSDNATCFTFIEMLQFLNQNGIKSVIIVTVY